MTYRKTLKLFLLTFACLILLLLNCTMNVAGSGTETGNARVVGIIYEPDGIMPAKYAKVSLIPSDYNLRHDLTPESTTTDNGGIYRIDSVSDGLYNLLASKGGNMAFRDSIVVASDSHTIVPPDTLKAPGGLIGVIRLQPGDDARTVFILFLGTNTWTMPDDSTGRFGVAGLGEGIYRVRILTTLINYLPKDTVVRVIAGTTDTLTHDIILQYTGIPVVTGLKAGYDTLRRVVMLTWNKPETGRIVAVYNIYRKEVDSTMFLPLKNWVADTMYLDSTGVEGLTYKYEVTAVDSNENEGVKSPAVSISIPGAISKMISSGAAGQ